MRDLNELTLPDLFQQLTDHAGFGHVLDVALKEDFGDAGDVTTQSIVDPNTKAVGRLVARQSGIMAGGAVIPHLCHRIEHGLAFEPMLEDGDSCEAGQCLGTLDGSLATMLMLERTILNYLGHLSGIATLTREFVQEIEGTEAVICDTRKTTPGLRGLEKYAVRCGGGTLHRRGLYDAALYKDNHLVMAGETFMVDVLAKAIDKARSEHDLRFVEVEVDTLDQLDQVLSLPEGYVDMILLDNMTLGEHHHAVERRNERRLGIQLEVSGGVTMHNLRDIAKTGVDRISIGVLTHSAPRLDIALDLQA